MRLWFIGIIAAGLSWVAAPASADTVSAEQIIHNVLESDPWGLSGAEVSAKITMKDKHAATSELAFTARSVRYAPLLAKSLVRFSAPAELAGAALLQIQRKDSDDDRYLFIPDLKRSRRISGNLRTGSFMGTDFTFADLDRRDLRESDATMKPDETIGKFACYRVDTKPKRSDSQYSHVEVWVRKDNFLPLKMQMYDKANIHIKTLTTTEVRRISGQWFISKSTMTNHQENHTTDLVLERIVPRNDLPSTDFTVSALEKL